MGARTGAGALGRDGAGPRRLTTHTVVKLRRRDANDTMRPPGREAAPAEDANTS